MSPEVRLVKGESGCTRHWSNLGWYRMMAGDLPEAGLEPGPRPAVLQLHDGLMNHTLWTPGEMEDVDLSIRRPRAFLPDVGRELSWTLTRLADQAILRTGRSTVHPDGRVTVAGLTLHRDPVRCRLEIGDAPVVLHSYAAALPAPLPLLALLRRIIEDQREMPSLGARVSARPW